MIDLLTDVNHPVFGRMPQWSQAPAVQLAGRFVARAMLGGMVLVALQLYGFTLPSWLFVLGYSAVLLGAFFGTTLFATLWAFQRNREAARKSDELHRTN